ncbi:phosphocholine-specific phospholipase C [Bradyrhizobium cenepequi]|uniref:phosphocholine-specific phospholipase C n=1 Tax=Bradyrhizobium cenepequi TaxID=2821403 RepID=UPI001CE27EEE|nr:phospholipase C, phosphocholine-specific [Bradyrhizobium cenepequi]
MFAPALARAATTPAHQRTGTIQDVEHVVILMQENRSFDHYFGTLRGVRGFADPHPIPLPMGGSVWSQRDRNGHPVHPFRFDTERTNFQLMQSLNHDRQTGHDAWNSGRYDRWIPAKSPLTMGCLTRDEIPYHFALADSFTVADSYFSSLLGPTCPNRLYLLTGCVDPFGRGGGPVVNNDNITQTPTGKVFGRGWVTYAERLQQAGVSWRAYRQGADPDSDDDSDGGMNMLLAFEAFQRARPGDPLHEFGVAPRRLETLKDDVLMGTLALVSWIFPPRIFCEHPSWPPANGVEYIARILDALTANPEVWSRTVFLLMYDENDGFFDHVVPPTPPLHRGEGISTTSVAGEAHGDGKPFGLGVRVPMIAISPWSRGGFVNSEVFDHSSIIRFLEARFGVHEPNISPWRRAVCGDLTSLFDFATPNESAASDLAMLDAFAPLPDQRDFDSYKAHFEAKPFPQAPARFPPPMVETGPRPARPLAYDVAVDADIEADGVRLSFRNDGAIGVALRVQDMTQEAPPRRYTLEPGRSLNARSSIAFGAPYALRVDGPNGFMREFRGLARVSPGVRARHVRQDGSLVIDIVNAGGPVIARLTDGYAATDRRLSISAGASHRERLTLDGSSQWYDVRLEIGDASWRLCGHVETGKLSASDPAIDRCARALRTGDMMLD